MQKALLFFGILWLLSGCSAKSNQVPIPVDTATVVNTITPTITPVITSSPFPTLVATRTATIVPIPSITIDYSIVGSLKDAFITIEDIPTDTYSDELAFFLDHFPSNSSQPGDTPIPNGPLPTIRDFTQEIIDAGDCQLDCARQKWQKNIYGFYEITISLSRFATSDSAEEAVASLHDLTLKKQSGEEYSYVLSEYCYDKLPNNAWIVSWYTGKPNGGMNTISASQGPILITLESNIPGDDGVLFACRLSAMAALQLAKLESRGFFP